MGIRMLRSILRDQESPSLPVCNGMTDHIRTHSAGITCLACLYLKVTTVPG